MAISIRQLHPLFCAEIGGVDTGLPMDDAVFVEIRAALDGYSVLVFHDQSLDDERQIVFSNRFGSLEMAGKANPATGTHSMRAKELGKGADQRAVRAGRARPRSGWHRAASARTSTDDRRRWSYYTNEQLHRRQYGTAAERH